MNGRSDRVAIVIPCYHVAAQIGDVIRSIPASYDRIVCVDDGSGDGTAAAIEAARDSRVTLLRHEHNRGVGAAMKTGYAEALRAGADVCVKMDGDGQMHADDLDALVSPLTEGVADYAKGNRFVDLRSLRAMPRARLLGNAVLSFSSKLACGYWNMLDVNNGYTAIRSETLRDLDLAAVDDRYFFETSMLIELNIRRASVVDVEMPARYGNEISSMHLGRVLASFPGRLVVGLFRRFYWRYLIEDFGAVSMCVLLGLPLVLFGTIFGAFHWIESIRSGRVASAGTVFVAALPIILGFQLLLSALLIDLLSSSTIKRRASRH